MFKGEDAELLQLFYSIIIQGRQDLEWASDEQSGFEMVLLRLLAFMPKKSNHRQPLTIDDAGDEPDQAVAQLESEQASILSQAADQRSTGRPSGLDSIKKALGKETPPDALQKKR